MNRKILLVDDEAHIRILLEQTLEELEDKGVELLFAENGEIALEKIKSEKPQLVLLDVMMPEKDGFQVCSIVKKDWKWEEIYIIILTAKGQESDREMANFSGANAYITKPFDPDLLLKMAEEILFPSSY